MKKYLNGPVKYFMFSMALVLFGLLAEAQQKPHFNHTTIYVVNLEKSADWYEKVLQLTRISEPFHDNRHVWFKMGDHDQLHVVSGAKEMAAHDINIHLAFSVKDLPAFMKQLDALDIKYGNWAGDPKKTITRPDKVDQIYFQDPDGYWIEVNNDGF
jgi:lactoylglutathione lyase